MQVALVLVPYDTARRGWRAGAGPEFLVQEGLGRYLEQQGHRVASTEVITDGPDSSPAEIRTAFELMRGVSLAAQRARSAGHFPIVLSGNCGVGAVGLLSALSDRSRATFWFDAHGEANTPDTTSSGFLDGMGLSILLGTAWKTLAASVPGFRPVDPATTFLLGARDLDPEEGRLIRAAGLCHLGVEQVAAELPACLGRAPLAGRVGYVHFDLDALDPMDGGSATAYPAPAGLRLTDLLGAVRLIRSHIALGGVTLASYLPDAARDRKPRDAAFAAIAACLGGG